MSALDDNVERAISHSRYLTPGQAALNTVR